MKTIENGIVKKKLVSSFAQYQCGFLAGNKELLSKMWTVAQQYCCIKLQEYKINHSLLWNDDEVNEKAYDCASYIVERFLKDHTFCIKKLSSYAQWVVLKILYRDKKWEICTISLNSVSETSILCEQKKS